MVEKLKDQWGLRDLPVLIAIAEFSDRGQPVSPSQIVEKTGLSEDEIQSAIRALERTGYIPKVQRKADGRAYFLGGITGAAYQVTGLHQSRDEAQTQFLELLAEAIEKERDPEKKSKLKKLLEVSENVGGQVVANLLGAVFARLTLG